MCGDLRNTGAVGGNPSMFSRIRPRPWGKFVVSALVLIRLGFSRPSTAANSLAASVPATKLLTVAEHELVPDTVPDSSGLAPPSTRYVVALTRVKTLARPPFGVVIIPRSSPLHGDGLAGAAVSVN